MDAESTRDPNARDDESLLVRIARRDAAALEALYDRYSHPVYSLTWSLLRDAQVSQEVTQDVFLAIWRSADAYDAGRGSPRSWILSMAHHKSIDAIRRSRRHATTPLAETMTDDSDVVDAAMRLVDGAHVRSALDVLSPDQRTAIVLAYFGGYTQREIADRLGAPLGTIKTRMRDGLLRLRAALGPAMRESMP